MQTAKQIMHEIADQLPEQASLEDAMYTLYIRQKLDRAREDIKAGRVITQEGMERKYLGRTR